MEIVKVNKENAKILFNYWNKIGRNIPYFYNTTYESFAKSLFDDSYNGMTIFRNNNIFMAKEDDKAKGFIQYGIPAFYFTKTGEITKDVNIGVIRNLYYEKEEADLGMKLLDLSWNFFEENKIKEIYAFYHAMGMSCNGNHGKLHEKFNYIGKLLNEKGLEIEHENIYYICDMNEKKLEFPNDLYIKASDLDFNRERFGLYDKNNNALGSAEIKHIENLTGVREKDIVYLVWIGIDEKIKGKGLGTEFLNIIIEYSLAKGYRYLHTDTALDNKVAQGFYIKNGFIDKGITRSYLMEKNS